MKIIVLHKHTCLICGKDIKDLTKSACDTCDEDAEKVWNKIMNKNMILVALIFIIASCNPEARLAKKCAERFPVRDSITVKERRITDTLILPDYWVEYLDTTICPPGMDTTVLVKTIEKRIPGRVHFIERIQYDTIRVKENTAKLFSLNYTIDSLDKALLKSQSVLERKTGRAKALNWAFIIIIAALSLVLIISRK